MERAEQDQFGRVVDRHIKSLFPDGAVRRAVLLRPGDDPAVPPGELVLRVFVPGAGGPQDYQRDLATWHEEHREAIAELRRELSLRLPSARLLEFAVDGSGSSAPRITVPDDGTLGAERLSAREIVTTALELLRANYVFPERAEQAAAAVEARLAAGEYDNLDELTLTELLTEHLNQVCDDKHLRVRLGPGPGRGPGPRPKPDSGPRRERAPEDAGPPDHEARRLAMRRRGRLRDNFGIHRVERLDGNVGYLDIRRVAVAQNAGPAISAAMELVAGTYALILDLRRNRGGSPDGVVYWCSYLFPGGGPGTHLNDIFHADTGETRQFWSLPYVPGERYLDRPVYVLASHETFSGGEDFCYTLQALGRATVIGETTGGGAHPTRGFPISASVHIGIPFARSVNPVTGTNWQGTGVVPDIAVPEAESFTVAYREALTHVLSADDVPRPLAEEARTALAALPPTGAQP